MIRSRTLARRARIPGCVRRLSNVERIFMTGATSSIIFTAKISGDVSKEKLVAALDCVRRMHPLIGSKIVFDKDGYAWFSTDGAPGTVLAVVPRTSETRWIEEIRQELSRPFIFETRPMIRFMLVYSPDASELIVHSSHCISDGTSAVNLIGDILSFYADPKKDMRVIQPPVIADYAHKGVKKPLSRYGRVISVSSFNRQWRKRPHPLTPSDFNEINSLFWKNKRYGFSAIELDCDETSDLVSRCRDHGVTIVSAISAAFLLARKDTMPISEDESNIVLPFDLRKRVGADIGNAYCYFADGVFLSVHSDGWTFWETALQIHRDFRKLMGTKGDLLIDIERLDPGLIDAVFGAAPYILSDPDAARRTENLSAFAGDSENIAFKLSRRWSPRYPCAVIANMGRPSIQETYGDIRLEGIYTTAPSGSPIPFAIAGSGIGGRLILCINYLEELSVEGRSFAGDVIRMRNRMLQYLGFPKKARDEPF